MHGGKSIWRNIAFNYCSRSNCDRDNFKGEVGGCLVITFQLIKGSGCFVVCAGAEAIKLLPTHTFG